MSRDVSQHTDRVYMAEIEDELKRNRSTIRVWEKQGWLPDGLEFHRDEAGWRYWTRDQLRRVKEWMAQRNPGRTGSSAA